MKTAMPISSFPPRVPSKSRLGLFLPLAFAGNVFVSTFSWFVVGSVG
jgi:hypothetical protein